MKIIECNTLSDLKPNWRDETPRMLCTRCGHYFRLGYGIEYDPDLMAVTAKHMELCEGDHIVTLMKVTQHFQRSL